MPQINTENRPRTRQRKPKPAPALEIPDIEENAAERKRVLNILAQRRYRQRKRQLRQDTTSSNPSDHVSRQGRQDHVHDGMSTGLSNSTEEDVLAASEDVTLNNTVSNSQQDFPNVLGQHLRDQSLDLGDINLLFRAVEMLPVDMGNFMADPLVPAITSSINNSFPATFDPPSLYFDSLQSSPHHKTSSSTQPSPPSLVHSPESQATSSSVVSTSESFPDSYLLPMTELTLLRALLRIAVRLNAHAVWDMTANSAFNSNADISWACDLPAAWKPTPLQITTPHHPLIDLLPWPAVRDRMLSVLSLPLSSQPMSNAVSEEPEQEALPKPPALQEREDGVPPLVGFIYDMEDGAEGIRIWGDDPYAGENWEVGQAVFQRWWFLFDRPVVERSNYLRRLRGAQVLHCT